MRTTDFLVVGGGILGVALALETRRRNPSATITLIEKEPATGRHASGRNSGVLHAGLYYRPGSLKARFSAEGNRRLTEYCVERGLPIARCGKLVVAREDAELDGLDELTRRARGAGVEVRDVDPAEARELDPAVRVERRALFSPTTSSVDSAAVVASLTADARAAGVAVETGVAFRGRRGGGPGGGAGHVVTSDGAVSAGFVINAAGAHADRVARAFGFGERYRILPFKGLYLRSARRTPVRLHVYPVPDLRFPFLGVHLTVAADGAVLIGPNAMPAFGREQYAARDVRPVEGLRTLARFAAIMLSRGGGPLRRLAVRELKEHSRRALVAEAGTLARDLPPAREWAWGRPGIRAQLVDRGSWTLVDDFVAEGDDRSYHVLNAVSPGFTCALPFAEHVLDSIEHGTRVPDGAARE